jgi:flagellar biosynthesis chaperone FliJ
MAPVFAKSAELDEIEKAWEATAAELQQITEDQERVRENIKALGDSSAERRLLERYTRQLDAQEDRVDALKKDQADFQARQAAAERELNDLIAALSFEARP